jgi:hypothetical protein
MRTAWNAGPSWARRRFGRLNVMITQDDLLAEVRMLLDPAREFPEGTFAVRESTLEYSVTQEKLPTPVRSRGPITGSLDEAKRWLKCGPNRR